MTTRSILSALLCFTSPLLASPRNSTDYSVAAESFDQGGATLASADYSANTSLHVVGSPSDGGPTTGYLAKGGFVGQLCDVVGLAPAASSTTLGEGQHLQLAVAQVFDDATLLPISPSLVTWSVTNGPIAGISAGGLASAGNVFENTPAMVCADYLSKNGTLSLTILNTDTDNFGTYAADGLPDDWQAQYFGLDNPQAAPDADNFGTGQTNLFKYLAGLNPTDPTSVFDINIQTHPDQSGKMQIVFSPVTAGRTYTVVTKSKLTDSNWIPLTGATETNNGQERTVTDLNPTGSCKFYRVLISKP